MADAPDRLERLREVLADQRAYVEQHGFLYDGPTLELEDLEWVIAEVEHLRALASNKASGRARRLD